jgi:hypothetical protein
MKKKVLSEQSLYYGELFMPKNFEINYVELVKDITISQLYNKKLNFSKEWDKINTYIIDYSIAYYKIKLQNLSTEGKFYLPLEESVKNNCIDLLNLKNYPDYVMLYGVEIEPNSCCLKIFYDDNKIKNICHDIKIENNKFIMFPAHLTYTISKNLSDRLNYILKITYHESK